MVHDISNDHLSVEKVGEIIYSGMCIRLSEKTVERVVKCREYLDNKIKEEERPVYGITTGFGSLCNVSIEKDKLAALQRNLVMSHACGTGEPVPRALVKIILLLKIQSLSYGYSGITLETLQRLVDFYNNDICPVIYQQGSLGASGDLAPLAHLSLPLLGLGEVYLNGEKISGEEMNRRFGWKPIELQSKEGLALLNGTQFMGGYAVWSLLNACRLSDWSDKIAALSIDAYDGCLSPFVESVHRVRPHKGQLVTAQAVYGYLQGSEIIVQPKEHVQDPYSFRCVPQVHGAVKDTIDYVKQIVTTEINSATDNPTVLPDEDMIVSAGNFHGEPLALAMDFLAIAVSELASISGQRLYQLISGKRGLPRFLVANPGINSGFMIPQYTAASIVSQNKQLCSPASVDSIESSLGQEDHVSMGANAATKCYKVVCNTERVLAIELMNGAQALEFRRPMHSSPVIENLVREYRKSVPFIENDEVLYVHINSSVDFLQKHTGK